MKATTRLRRAAAVPALIAALAAPLLLATAPAEAEPASLDTGSLIWGLRQSWRTYVGPENMTTTGGATADAAGIVTFPLADGTFDETTGTTMLYFGGTVRYVGHCGHYPNGTPEDCALDLTLSDLRLVIDKERQTLSAHVRQRPLGTGDDVPPIADLGVVDLVDLDLRGVTPDTGGGTTTWDAVPAFLDAAAVSVFGSYQAGAVMDPVTVAYEGPGGLPDFDEEWTEPGTVLMEQTAAYTDTGSWAKANYLFPDESNGIVHAVNEIPPTWTAFAEALDADTLEPVGDSGAFGTGLTAGTSLAAFDPASATLYAAATGTTPELWALAWQPDAKTYAPQRVDTLPADAVLGGALVWDPSVSRLYLRVRTGGAQYLYAWQRTETGWARTEYALPQVAGWNYNAYYGEAGASAFVPLGDGSLLLARKLARNAANQALYDPTMLRLRFADGQVAVEEVAGSGTNRPAAEVGNLSPVALAVAGDRLAVVRSDPGKSSSVQYGSVAEGVLELEPERHDLGVASATLSAAFDRELLWVKNYGAGSHAAVDGTGQVRSRFTLNGGGFTAPIAVTADRAVVTSWRDTGSVPGTARFDRAAVSPGVAAHPADAAVSVEGPDGTAEAVFAAAADEESTVRWQTKSPDALVYTDIEGADETELRTEVGAVHHGWLFRAVFTNAAGSIATEPAELRVTVTEVPSSEEPSSPASESPSEPTTAEPSSEEPTTDGPKPSVPMPEPTQAGTSAAGTAPNNPSGPRLPSLPVTGASLTALLAAAAGTVGTGVILAVAARKRRAAGS
ncbi:HtaA domain-containing protein [Glycomyces sp. NPDC048151]|uniref:HtaA domain-containing protein n=1 Tax=Glycomyces sp. NPDC048151 TaxID=3364002 RepID=UPI0037140C1C